MHGWGAGFWRDSQVGGHADPHSVHSWPLGHIGATVVGATVVGAIVVGATLVGDKVVGATVDGATVVGATVVGDAVVGDTVDGETVVGATVVGAMVVGATVVGATVVGATGVGATVVGTTVVCDVAGSVVPDNITIYLEETSLLTQLQNVLYKIFVINVISKNTICHTYTSQWMIQCNRAIK